MNYLYVDGIEVQVVRRRVKNLSLRINQSDGTVLVTAPMRCRDDQIEQFVRSKAAWISQHHQAVLASPMHLAEQASPEEVRQWRAIVQAGTELLVEKWAPVLGVRPKTLAYRNMRSRWGSCTPDTGRVCINVRLALYPPQCLEYVVVHELCHFFVRNHGSGFTMLMDRHLPNWRESRKLLETYTLGDGSR
ncbi:MAG: SprT family zinc-dependent metalloprotease [Coriobacteriaceae bacterium]|nr:SprT family zinc-dependent metalloprotease [Coriobacteriaceae bacterium]